MLKIGILGGGFLGRIHMNALKDSSVFQVIGFYDHDSRKAIETEILSGVKKFDSLEDLVNGSDVVDVVTSTPSHYELALFAIKKLKHLFIEKPMTENVNDARAIAAYAKEAGVLVQVGHVERFNPAFTAALPYFDSPMFIEGHRLAEFNPRGTDVSVIHDLMIHDIDIVLRVVKSPIKQIRASGVAVISDTPDIANARIEFLNGCVANLTASRISMKTMRKSRFFQKDAYISVDYHKKETSVIRIRPVTGEPEPYAMIIDPGPDKPKKQLSIENPNVENVNAIKIELESFAEAIHTHSIPVVTADDGIRAVETAQSIIEKIELREKI